METSFQTDFQKKWNKYFGKARLPICWFYSDSPNINDLNDSKNVDRCLIGNLNQVFEGKTYIFQKSSSGCPGGKRYSGFSQKLRPDFRYFLSCGIEGKMEGERYKKTPELVDEQLKHHLPFESTADYLVFKRWDKLLPDEFPEVVVFLDSPDIISGLFTLANFDSTEANGVMAPFGSGCASIIDYPLRESKKENPKCIFGMFDISARQSILPNYFSFSIPLKRFKEMAANMDESFLITESWQKIKNRL